LKPEPKGKVKGIEVSKEEFLKTKPLRNPSLKWEKQESGEVRVFIPLKRGLTTRFLLRFARIPPEKKILLDKIGAHVWSLCDGKHTFRSIRDSIHREYKLASKEAEAALKTYFMQLSKRQLVGFILPKEVEARFKEQLKIKSREAHSHTKT